MQNTKTQQTENVQDCLKKTADILKKGSKDFDIKDFPVDATEKKKAYIKSTLEADPFRIFVSKEHGGFGGDIKESLSLLQLASYESLQLTLVYGINWALFIQPLEKYGTDQAKAEILPKVCHEKAVGGLMITEPGYGSDALNMKTQSTPHSDHFHIQGEKHWGGLTGIADHWVITCRELKADGGLGRDIDFFINDNNNPDQKIYVPEYYNTGGLEIITYGRNELDIKLPVHQKFNKPSTGIKMMLNCLHRSRIQFSGMGMGFHQRLLDEGLRHCQERKVSNKSLIEYDKVRERLAGMQAAYTINNAMCYYASKTTQLENDLAMMSLEANCVKTLLTDLMQESAQSLVQLKGGNGYIKDDIAGRAIMDSRPFQIFEGSNDILYIQIGEAINKKMLKAKTDNYLAFISAEYPEFAYQPCLTLLSAVKLPPKGDQRKLHTFGEIYASLFSLYLIADLSKSGYNQDLILQANLFLAKRIKQLITKMKCILTPEIIVDYQAEADWKNLA